MIIVETEIFYKQDTKKYEIEKIFELVEKFNN